MVHNDSYLSRCRFGFYSIFLSANVIVVALYSADIYGRYLRDRRDGTFRREMEHNSTSIIVNNEIFVANDTVVTEKPRCS